MDNAVPGPFRGWPKSRALGLVALAYGLAVSAAAVAVWLLPLHPLAAMALATGVGTGVIFAFSLLLKNSSLYDPYWSVAPMAIVLWWLVHPSTTEPVARNLLITALVLWWGTRLTFNWARGWQGLGHEDWRYEKIRLRTGPFYWPVSLLGIHCFPTVQVFLGLIPVHFAMTATTPLGLLDVLAFAVTALGISWEMVADRQLHRFRHHRERSDATLTTGLWRYSRHPNYFGELAFWVGLALFALASGRTEWWCYIGAVSMILMFRFISLPLIDERMCERHPGYRAHMERTSAFVPWRT